MNSSLIQLLNYSLGQEVVKYFSDDSVIEIMLNDDGKLWIDTFDGTKDTGVIIDNEKALSVAYLLASHIGAEINQDCPHLGGELPGTGFRFQIEIPPIVSNVSFNIRKKAIRVFSLNDYLKNEVMTIRQKNIIEEAVKDRKNILVVGGTSSGKTTLCNAILKEIAKYKNRVVLIEDVQELQCETENKVRMKTCKNTSIRDLIKITMRKTPERIIVGEIRDGAALDLLKAWNSGHPGGISTIHADDCLGGLEKLEQYIQEVSANPQSKLIARAVDLVVVIAKVEGQRKITQIVTVDGYKNGEYILNEVV
ncbi:MULTISPECIES: P-type conjugative transfer ATPase TrbB [unclassified Cetobacterium]|uniref:P-type conjugative transfer ATPase TrbB n=1 Tax=unclassified Cetobacterium TaxID=2630983 RepID=UPI0006488F1A|nr:MULTISPECIES: P-type conjugative transfer ATPase TrbB [unclassified Cetobacterium]